jgi:hypothetical protein
MNKILKGLLLSVLILTLSFNMLPLGAQNVDGGTIAPMNAVAVDTSADLTLTGSRLKATVAYIAGVNLTSANVYTFLQRYVDGVWRAASSVPAECGWIDESTATYDEFTHSMTLTVSGSYRVKAVFYLYGSGDDMDRIEKYDYCTYTAS